MSDQRVLYILYYSITVCLGVWYNNRMLHVHAITAFNLIAVFLHFDLITGYLHSGVITGCEGRLTCTC